MDLFGISTRLMQTSVRSDGLLSRPDLQRTFVLRTSVHRFHGLLKLMVSDMICELMNIGDRRGPSKERGEDQEPAHFIDGTIDVLTERDELCFCKKSRMQTELLFISGPGRMFVLDPLSIRYRYAEVLVSCESARLQPLACFGLSANSGMVLEEPTDGILPDTSSPASILEFQNSESAEMGKKAEGTDEFDRLMTSVRISATSRALGFIWFILTYLFAPGPPNMLIPAIIFVGVGVWYTWEKCYWHGRWKRQEKDAVELMNSLAECLSARNLLRDLDASLRDDPNSLLPAAYNRKVTEVLKAIQNLASDIAVHTNHTPLRYIDLVCDRFPRLLKKTSMPGAC
jgi:hypothetical protein